MSQRIFFSALLILWLASRASADGGDDFANNLASDLGPIIALFGERVVMQFMSQAMGIADCILLAVAPIGAITTVVSAIRVAGPAWLKSFIGRARENLAAAEVEVMSSTSTETCELWNGNSVVRCPGSADIYQFICLVPKDYDFSEPPLIPFEVECKALIADATKLTEKNNDGNVDYLKPTKRSGPTYFWQSFKNSIHSMSGKLKRLQKGFRNCIKAMPAKLRQVILSHRHAAKEPTPSKTESQQESNTDSPTRSSKNPALSRATPDEVPSTDHSKRKEDFKVIVIEDTDGSAPNLLLNCHDRVGRKEIYVAATIGLMLQFGAVAYFAFITYYKPTQDTFLKDGRRAVQYAFPCAAVGTMLLILGLFICSWVVGESTNETCYEAENHHIYVVWLQKDHTVSDQVFKPFAVYPVSKRDCITVSRRNNELFNSDERGLRKGNKNDKSTLEGITFIGALISLIGFISQFIGMRGLNWTASIVQLGITILVTILRVIVRRGLGKPPAYTSLNPKFELDWFVLSFGKLPKAPWANSGHSSRGSNNRKNDSTDETSSNWEICTGGELTYHTDCIEDSEPQRIMMMRKRLGELSKWKSPILEEADHLSRAIETVANKFLSGQPKERYYWSIPAIYTETSSSDPVEGKVYITISKDGSHGWQVDKREIEAILSLWLYSTSSTDHSKTSRLQSLRVCGPSASQKNLDRDFEWWMPENIPQTFKYPEQYLVGLFRKGSEHTIVGLKAEDSGANRSTNTPPRNDPIKEYLVLQSQDNHQRLFSRELFVSFMRAIIKMPEVGIGSSSSTNPLTSSIISKGWSHMKLKNDIISDLARRLEKTGFGSLSDIYTDLIIPLSLEHKLTNVESIIDNIAMIAHEHERSFQWKKLVDTCLRLLSLALLFDLKRECSYPRAIAVCLGFLHRLQHESKLQESERRTEEELTIQLSTLKRKFIRDTNFSAILPDESTFSAVSLSILAGLDPNSTTSFPDSFQISADILKFIKKDQLQQESHTLDIKDLEKTDAFGWSLLHYAANLTSDLGDSYPESGKFPSPRDLMGWTPLHHACFFGNEKLVDKLLHHGALIEIAGNDGITPMHCAVQSGNAKIASKLFEVLRERHETNSRKSERHVDRNERHPIHWAAVEGNVEMVHLMKDDISLTDRFGWTPLHLAALYEHEKLLQYFFENHIEAIELVDNELRTPLHLAVEKERKTTTVQILLQAGAKVNTIAKYGLTPLHVAAKQNQKHILALLLSNGANKEAMDMKGRTPLYLSVEDGVIETTSMLIDEGANVKAAAKDGRSPLHVALSSGQGGLEIAKILVRAGADVNTKAEDGATVLHIAAQCGSLFDILNVLPKDSLESPVINALDEYGQTPLLIAIYEQEWEAAKLLLKRGASVDAGQRKGYTPLLGAVIGEDEDILQQLLDKGGNANDADEDDYSALHLAIQNRNHKMVSLLLKAGANIEAVAGFWKETPLHMAVRKGDIEIVQTLLTEGANTLLLNSFDFSPLQYALYGEDLPMVRILIEHDKNSTIKAALQPNKEGDTPLHTLAACTEDEDIICEMLDELLSVGPEIDINAKNTEGRTPLDAALFIQPIERRKFIAKLLERGAEPGSDYTKGYLEDWNKEGLED